LLTCDRSLYYIGFIYVLSRFKMPGATARLPKACWSVSARLIAWWQQTCALGFARSVWRLELHVLRHRDYYNLLLGPGTGFYGWLGVDDVEELTLTDELQIAPQRRQSASVTGQYGRTESCLWRTATSLYCIKCRSCYFEWLAEAL
jgi:hypothetical protein